MFKNFKKINNIIIILVFLVALVYFLILLVMSIFNKTTIPEELIINSNNVEIYVKDDYLLINEYSKFYSIEKNLQKIITALHDNKYEDVKTVISKEYKEKYSNINEKLANYYNTNFKYEKDELEFSGYINSKNLLKVYSIDEENYICVIKSINEAKSTKIGLRIVDTKFEITYLEI